MPVIALMKVDGSDQEFFAFTIKTDSFKNFSTVTGDTTSAIQGGTVSLKLSLDLESNSTAFFATWFLENSQKNAIINLSTIDRPETFLTIEALDARLVSYNIDIDQTIDKSVENSFINILLLTSSLGVGPAPLSLGFGQ